MSKGILALRGYTRAGSFPLDTTSYYEDYDAALNYVHNSKAVYLGQVISVNDQLRNKVKMYYVTYDNEEDATYRYKLEEIGVGVSGGRGNAIVNYKGKVSSYDDLYEIDEPQSNDMYYVMNSNASGYSAYVYQDGSWTRLDLGITLASAKTDGLITKEMYRSLMSNSEAIYYSPGTNDPNENRFIQFETTGDTDSLSVMSTDKLKETIHSLITVDKPYVTITTSVDLSDVLVGAGYHDCYFTIKYYPNGAGDIKTAKLTSGYMQDVNLTGADFEYNYDENCYEYTYVLMSFTISEVLDRNFFAASIDYNGNQSLFIDDGNASAIYKINAFKHFDYRYGYYQDGLLVYSRDFYYGTDASRAKENYEYNIKIIPDVDHGVNRIEVLSPYEIKEVIFTERNMNILDKFIRVYSSEGYRYVYETYRDYPITGEMNLIVRT